MKNDKIKNQYRVNEQIRVREVRVVSEDGSEVMPTRKALDMARNEGVDLVEISPNAQPPVCRLIDYSKFLYQQKKRQKEMKQKQVKQEVKEIRFGPQTAREDCRVRAELHTLSIYRLRSIRRARHKYPVLCHKQRAADSVHDSRCEREIPFRRRTGTV